MRARLIRAVLWVILKLSELTLSTLAGPRGSARQAGAARSMLERGYITEEQAAAVVRGELTVREATEENGSLDYEVHRLLEGHKVDY